MKTEKTTSGTPLLTPPCAKGKSEKRRPLRTPRGVPTQSFPPKKARNCVCDFARRLKKRDFRGKPSSRYLCDRRRKGPFSWICHFRRARKTTSPLPFPLRLRAGSPRVRNSNNDESGQESARSAPTADAPPRGGPSRAATRAGRRLVKPRGAFNRNTRRVARALIFSAARRRPPPPAPRAFWGRQPQPPNTEHTIQINRTTHRRNI